MLDVYERNSPDRRTERAAATYKPGGVRFDSPSVLRPYHMVWSLPVLVLSLYQWSKAASTDGRGAARLVLTTRGCTMHGYEGFTQTVDTSG